MAFYKTPNGHMQLAQYISAPDGHGAPRTPMGERPCLHRRYTHFCEVIHRTVAQTTRGFQTPTLGEPQTKTFKGQIISKRNNLLRPQDFSCWHRNGRLQNSRNTRLAYSKKCERH